MHVPGINRGNKKKNKSPGPLDWSYNECELGWYWEANQGPQQEQ